MCAAQPPALPAALAVLAGFSVIRVAVDDALTLTLQGVGGEATLRLDGEVLLQSDSAAARFCVDTDPSAAGPALGLLQRRVRRLRLEENGTLHIEWDGTLRLSALAHDHQVSWQVRAADGSSATCLAEGRVVWS